MMSYATKLYALPSLSPRFLPVWRRNLLVWRKLARRLEVAGETAFCYAMDAQPLLADLALRDGVHYLHRPANLEDLFIKLTGRELRD